jgi:hypothetical protein
MAPMTINATRPTVRECPSSHRRHCASLSAERSGANRTTAIGATIDVIDASAKTTNAITESAVET